MSPQAMLGAFTQDTLLLPLATPLGRHRLTVECMRGDEGTGPGFRFHLTTHSTDTDIAPNALIGQPALLQLQTATSRDERRPFHGYITAMEQSAAKGGLACYHLTLEPWTAFLDRARASRVFQNMTVFHILDCVFAPWQGKGRLAPAWRFDIGERANYPIRNLTTQYQESDLAFAERLMSEEGLSHYFEHAGAPDKPDLGSHTMVIGDHHADAVPRKPALSTLSQSQPSQQAECAI